MRWLRAGRTKPPAPSTPFIPTPTTFRRRVGTSRRQGTPPRRASALEQPKRAPPAGPAGAPLHLAGL